MGSGNGIVRAESALSVSGSVEIRGIAEVFRLADALSRASGFVPAAYMGKADAIAAAILTGVELGMGPMEALREISVVQGRPTLSAACMLGRAIRAGIIVEWVESTRERACLRLTRGGVSYEQEWTIQQARAAGLLEKKGPWHQYPDAMLRARAISAAVRAFAPDVIGGGRLYTPEEARDIPPEREAPPPRVHVEPRREDTAQPVDDGEIMDDSESAAQVEAVAALRERVREQVRATLTAPQAVQRAALAGWCREGREIGVSPQTINGWAQQAATEAEAIVDDTAVAEEPAAEEARTPERARKG